MISFEIERKFLTTHFDPEILCDLKFHSIEQFYLNDDPNRTVRIRIKDDKAFITIKGKSMNDGLKRVEWEKEIDINEARCLKDLAIHHTITKKRYLYPHKNHIFEIDVFEGNNAGLILVEVEIENENTKVDKPQWIGNEVTGDKRYYNLQLAKHPIKKESGF